MKGVGLRSSLHIIKSSIEIVKKSHGKSSAALTELNKKIQDYNPVEKLKLQSFWENPNKNPY